MLPRLCFSTLACPNWSVETVIQSARTWGYDGIEWRGGDAGHVNPKLARAERTELRERVRDANLFSLAVTGYTRFVDDDSAARSQNVDELKRYLDLAADVQAQYVRAFLGEVMPHQKPSEMTHRIVESLQQCIPHANGVGVGIAVEHHDDFVQTGSLVPILAQLSDPSLGAVWDIANAYSAGETPEQGAENLRGRIFYVQVKDGVGQRMAAGEHRAMENHREWELTDVGAGQVKLRRAMELLFAQNYDGAFSVEWEYDGHPELKPPERALPEALTTVRAFLNQTFAQVSTSG